jgi:hypothetical protein
MHNVITGGTYSYHNALKGWTAKFDEIDCNNNFTLSIGKGEQPKPVGMKRHRS